MGLINVIKLLHCQLSKRWSAIYKSRLHRTPRIKPGAAGWEATSVLCRPLNKFCNVNLKVEGWLNAKCNCSLEVGHAHRDLLVVGSNLARCWSLSFAISQPNLLKRLLWVGEYFWFTMKRAVFGKHGLLVKELEANICQSNIFLTVSLFHSSSPMPSNVLLCFVR